MTSFPDMKAVADLAVAAAFDGGRAVLSGFGEATVAERKGDQHDIVTVHDRRTEVLIRKRIKAEFPDSSILGEETGKQGTGRLKWFIDPIDGTKNFAAGIPFFCVSIGVAYDDELVGAAIYDPVRDEMFHANQSSAMLNEVPIQSSGAKHPPDSLLLMDAPDEGPNKSAPQESVLSECLTQFGTVRRLGSCALELAYVASGRADVQVGLAVFPWDVAAGILLVTMAGGKYHTPVHVQQADALPWLSRRFVAHSANFELDSSPVLTSILSSSHQ